MDAKLSACQGKVSALLAAVFLAGVLGGGLGMQVWNQKQMAEQPDTLGVQSQVALDKLSVDLALEPSQVGQVKTILDKYIMLEADLMSQMRSLQNQGRAEILQQLDHQQRLKFEAMFQPVVD